KLIGFRDRFLYYCAVGGEIVPPFLRYFCELLYLVVDLLERYSTLECLQAVVSRQFGIDTSLHIVGAGPLLPRVGLEQSPVSIGHREDSLSSLDIPFVQPFPRLFARVPCPKSPCLGFWSSFVRSIALYPLAVCKDLCDLYRSEVLAELRGRQFLPFCYRVV